MSIEKHTRFMTLLSAGLPIPSDLADWYLAAYDRYKQENKSLCTCLGIRGAGIRSAKTRELIKRRNRLIEWAVRSCKKYPGEPLWSQCGTLAVLIERWPRSRYENPLLQHIFALGCDIPTSQNRIHEIIQELDQYPPYSHSKKLT